MGEMILRCLQLTPEALRELATASSVEIAMLPWPSQKQVLRRKAKLRETLEDLMNTGRQHGTGDVEEILKIKPELKKQTRSALIEGGSSFTDGFERWAAGDWDLSPSPSRSRSRDEGKNSTAGPSSRSKSRKKKKKKKGRRRSTSSSETSRRKRKADTDSRSASPVKNGNKQQKKQEDPKPDPKPSFTTTDLETLSAAKLRALCVQHGVLPVGAVEKSDLLKALTPLAVVPPKPAAP